MRKRQWRAVAKLQKQQQRRRERLKASDPCWIDSAAVQQEPCRLEQGLLRDEARLIMFLIHHPEADVMLIADVMPTAAAAPAPAQHQQQAMEQVMQVMDTCLTGQLTIRSSSSG
jgi:hypothetical protein